VFRVAVLGSSFTLGAGVPIESTYHSVLSATARQSRPSSSRGLAASSPSTSARSSPGSSPRATRSGTSRTWSSASACHVRPCARRSASSRRTG
jgi:hypothetical protein